MLDRELLIGTARKGSIELFVISNPEPGNRIPLNKSHSAIVSGNSHGPELGCRCKSMEMEAGVRFVGLKLTKSNPGGLASFFRKPTI
jgi:hypothetical protein